MSGPQLTTKLPVSPPIKHQPNLLTLPKEIIAIICALLPLGDLLSFGRVCRRSTTFVRDELLWHTLHLDVPVYCGELPLIQPHSETDSEEVDPYYKWAVKEAREAEKRRRSALQDKVMTLMNRGDETKWGLVRKLRMVPRPLAALGLVHLLEFVAETLESLVIEGPIPHRHPFIRAWRPKGFQTLDAKMVGFFTFFPALTSIKIAYGSVYYPGLVSLLVNLSPNLTELDVDIVRNPLIDPDEPQPVPSFPPIIKDTLIRNMSIRFGKIDDSDDSEFTAVVKGLLKKSPKLEQLVLNYIGEDAETMRGVSEGLKGNEALQDLHVVVDELDWLKDLAGAAFKNLRRLVVQSMDLGDVFLFHHDLPNLETMVFDGTYRFYKPLLPPSDAPEATEAQSMLPTLAMQLQASPRLTTLHTHPTPISKHDLTTFQRLDEIEASTEISGKVFSLRHGDEELLHARLFIDGVEIYDKGPPFTDSDKTPTMTVFGYRDRHGKVRERAYDQTEAGTWQIFTDYKGLTVPLAVIERMREAEGVEKDAWQGRGIEVGEAAWKVLEEWYATASLASN